MILFLHLQEKIKKSDKLYEKIIEVPQKHVKYNKKLPIFADRQLK